MKKIVLIPLDERPCNYNFPVQLAKETDFDLRLPPRALLGNKKTPSDNIEGLWQWLCEEAADCDAAIISVDTLLFSGIVPSRLHNQPTGLLLEKLNRLSQLKLNNPSMTLYAFNLIMRNPSYSSSDEEPDYYGEYGREIHRFGVIEHLREIGLASESDMEELNQIQRSLPKEYLNDYLTRRQKNLEVNKRVVELTAQHVIDFLIIPQDDASLYGLTAKDQRVIRQHIADCKVALRAYMYPDADAVANTLLARYINQATGRTPLVYVKYASGTGASVVPLYEDRIVSESIKYQILAAGGLVASSVQEADIVLIVNVPSAAMQDHLRHSGESHAVHPSIEYDACRNLVEVIEYARYAVSALGKNVVIGDIAYANGGDPLLFDMLQQKELLYEVAGYAGWNTSSNSLGTCIPMGMIYAIYGNRPAHTEFLALRYLEDVGFCAFARQDVCKMLQESHSDMNLHTVDGPRGTARDLVFAELDRFAREQLSDERYRVRITDCYLPWSRLFEVGLHVKVEQKS